MRGGETMLEVGDRAPLFSAEGTEGQTELEALLVEGPQVLYFFPRAFTPG